MNGFILANAIAKNLLEMHEHEGGRPSDCNVPEYDPTNETNHVRAYKHTPVDNAKAFWWRYASPTGFRVAVGELCGPDQGYFRPDLSLFQLGFVSHFLALRYGVTYAVESPGQKIIVTATDGEYSAENKADADAVRSSCTVVAEALYDFFVAMRGEWEAKGKAVPFSRW